MFLETPRPGFTPPPGFFSLLQGLRTQFLAIDPTGAKYALALNLDDQIDGIIFPPAPISPEDKQTQGDQLLGLIADWKNGLSSDGLSNDDLQKLDDKAAALRLRLIDDGGIAPPTDTTSSTSSTEQTPPPPPTNGTNGVPKTTTVTTSPTTQAPPPPPPPTSDVPPPQGCTYQSFTLLAKPATNLNVGDQVTLSLYGTCATGQTDDLTWQSSFSAALPSDGSFAGVVFTPAHSGTITLHGLYTGKTVSTTISVNGATTRPKVRTLTSVKAGAIGTTSLTTGQSAPLTATAYYSDGSMVDVVYQCAWTTSGKLGSVSAQRFYAGTGTGTVSASCSYTDAGSDGFGERHVQRLA